MQTTSKIWFDGKIIDWDSAKIHVLTHTLHYGAGVFEGVRFYDTKKGPAVFRLKDHVERLYYSASVIDMKIPFSKDEFQSAILETIRVNKIKAGYIRPICFYGYGKMGLNPEGAPINCAIALWPWGSYLGNKPVRVKISKFIRIPPQSVISDAKISGYYANSIFASIEAHKQGYDEALFLDYKGYVAEGPGENIFMVKDNVLITPAKGAILPGITRDSVMQIAKRENIEVIEKVITLDELKTADELFFTGTAAEISPIASIDNSVIGNGAIGSITLKLEKLFSDVFSARDLSFIDWLSFV